jgi:prolyl-tRNA synthetase
MRMTRLVGKTSRTAPAEAELPSHQLMLQAGMLHQIAAGIYSYAPLAQRSLNKVATILREEMDAVGGQEVKLPAVQPQELWEQSGRAKVFGPDMARLNDRRARPMVLAPTHEEAVTLLVRNSIRSYRDLPLLVYQIQTKFRDEPRPRGGLIRVREFDMKDAYSFDADEEGLAKSYLAMIQAYERIFSRCGLPVVRVEADSGAIGGKESHEFILPSQYGEDTIILCGNCDYAANAERAKSKKFFPPEEARLSLEEVSTPGVKTIEEVSAFLRVPPNKTLKAVFYIGDGQPLLAIIRGDLNINEVKLKGAVGCQNLRLATTEETLAAGLVPGSASAVGLQEMNVVADDSISIGNNFIVGANRDGYHLRNANHPRDFTASIITDIAMAEVGHACPACGETLTTIQGIEVGHVFKLGTFFSEVFGANFLDTTGKQRPAIMGCYGIGVGRLLAAAIEEHHDERGMCLPSSISPYNASLIALNTENAEVERAAEELYLLLQKAGVDVLLDDRLESAGVKFKDADLLGFPVRIVVSPRNLKEGTVELKDRLAMESTLVPHQEVVDKVTNLLTER